MRNDDYYITMYGIKTIDGYDKSKYKWDPQLKKTVYIGGKAKSNKQDAPSTKETNKPDTSKNINKGSTPTEEEWRAIWHSNSSELANNIGTAVEEGWFDMDDLRPIVKNYGDEIDNVVKELSDTAQKFRGWEKTDTEDNNRYYAHGKMAQRFENAVKAINHIRNKS